MADGHVFRSSYAIALFFLAIILSAGRLSFEDGFCRTTTPNLKFGLYDQPGKTRLRYILKLMTQRGTTAAMIPKLIGSMPT